MRVVALSMGVPFPPLGGGLIRTFQLLKALAPYHDVTLAAFTYGEPHDDPPYRVTLRAVPWKWSADYRAMTGSNGEAARHAYERLTFGSDEPWLTGVMDPAPMQAALEEILRTPPDLVLFEGTPLARFLDVVPSHIPRVLDLFDVHSIMARQTTADSPADRDAWERDAARTLAFESRAARECDACLAVSDADATAARDVLRAKTVHLVPNGVDTSYFVPKTTDVEPGALLFTGRMTYEPNEEAACYFAEQILPLVRREMPHATFHIVGASPSPRVTALTSASVIVHGHVEDMREHQWRCEAVVVPIRSGGGTRLKVLEAAACGKPIVSTPLGVAGLPFRDGHDALIASTPQAFASAVVAVLRNRGVAAATLGANARQIAARYDWSAIGISLRRILERVVRDRA